MWRSPEDEEVIGGWQTARRIREGVLQIRPQRESCESGLLRCHGRLEPPSVVCRIGPERRSAGRCGRQRLMLKGSENLPRGAVLNLVLAVDRCYIRRTCAVVGTRAGSNSDNSNGEEAGIPESAATVPNAEAEREVELYETPRSGGMPTT